MSDVEHDGGKPVHGASAQSNTTGTKPTAPAEKVDILQDDVARTLAPDLPILDLGDIDALDPVGGETAAGSSDDRPDQRRWRRGVRHFDGLGQSIDLLAELAIKACVTRRTLKALRAAEPVVVLVSVPSPAWVKPIEAVIRRISQHKAQCLARSAPPRASATVDPDAEAADLIAGGQPVVAITPEQTWVAPLLVAAADHIVTVPPIETAMANVAIQVWCGRRARSALIPGDLCGLDLTDLAAALRPGASPGACVTRIRRASRMRVGPRMAGAVMPLDQLKGYGDAQGWAMRVAADIARVRRGELTASALEGAVLFGPPGTGKTTLARALAQAAGVVCIETSVGQWFANSPGFLDSIIKQISLFCDRLELYAKQDGCAIGFLDELDAMPNRSRLDDRGASWWQPVITYFLIRVEALRNAGVVLLAATNHLDRVDAALLRPGRFDRQFLIGPPDEAGRIGILRNHLGNDLTGIDLTTAARLSHGMTGAVLAGGVRAARRRAQADGRPMQLDDLLAEIAPADPRPVAHLRRIALHEAGHALVGHRLGFTVEQVTLQAGATHAGATLMRITDPMPDRIGLERQVIGLLAGRAADAVLGNGVTAGASSDLREATRLLSALHASLGLGATLRAVIDQEHAATLLREDPVLAELVEEDLRRLQGIAETHIRADRTAILALADALLTHRVMTGAEVAVIAGQHRPRIRVPASASRPILDRPREDYAPRDPATVP